MNAKWYFGALFLIFSYFGVFHETVSVPNQELVLEFTNTEVDQREIRNTINEVRKKLLDIGVSNIKIEETESSTLKISYYSFVHIDNIKEALSDENELLVNQNSEDRKNEESSLAYKIDVYEITDTSDLSGRNDKLVFEIKVHSDRFTNDQRDYLAKYTDDSKESQQFKIAYKEYKNDPYIKEHASHSQPEVRAGPIP
jgi:hypothetical protein